jgi:hypothetical protein
MHHPTALVLHEDGFRLTFWQRMHCSSFISFVFVLTVRWKFKLSLCLIESTPWRRMGEWVYRSTSSWPRPLPLYSCRKCRQYKFHGRLSGQDDVDLCPNSDLSVVRPEGCATATLLFGLYWYQRPLFVEVFPGCEGEAMGVGLLCPRGLLMGWIRVACAAGLQDVWGINAHTEAERRQNLPR